MALETKQWRQQIERICELFPPLPPDILEAVVLTESGGNPNAESVSNAIGLGQIIYRWHSNLVDRTAAELGKTGGEQALYDPEVNLRVAAAYLRYCYTSDGSQSYERAVRKYHSGSASPPPGFVDGGGTSSDQHITKYLANLQRVREDRASAPPSPAPIPSQEAPMAYTTTVPGVPGGPITTSFPVKLLIAPAWRTNVRPGIKARTPRRNVQHETANPNSMAVHDATYLYNGSGGRQASWHITVDDREAYIGIPLDEVTWQAGDGAGPGNYNGISCELAVASQIVNSNARRAQSQKNAAEIMGIIGARLNATPPARQHADYMNKNCPAQMRNRGEWNRYVGWWHEFYNAEKARMAGGTPEPAPSPTPAFAAGDRFRIIADAVNVRVGWGTSSRILTTLHAGDTGTVIKDVAGRTVETANGYTWIAARFDQFDGTGWIATGLPGEPWVERIAKPAPTPEPAPQYAAKSPVTELLGTDIRTRYNTAEGITTVNELEFIFVADVIEFKRTSKALQYGYGGAPEVKAPYQEGDRAIAAWLVKSTEGIYYYLLTGGDDEWVRVRYTDTVRISDAPLLPDEKDIHETAETLTDVLKDVTGNS